MTEMAAPPPLSRDTVHAAMEEVCAAASALHKDSRWSFRRSTTINDELLFGIESSQQDNSSYLLLATFYFAYSTWDGRILYLDQIDDNSAAAATDSGASENSLHSHERAVRHILAKIACRCHCSRFTWQHDKQDHARQEQIMHPFAPEFLDGWLTLQWPCDDAMKATLSLDEKVCSGSVVKTANNSDDKTISVRQAIQTCLLTPSAQQPQQQQQHYSSFSLRLANENDLPAIGRLVQGLADFEKEPDAVHVTLDHYRNDGGFAALDDNDNKINTINNPLFYCLLLETKSSDDGDDNNNKYICGMAFCYLGCTRQQGRHWYLEDLFLEQAYRGQGAGTYIMTTLARIGLALGCSHLRWQALDWNTPALTFYAKLGARVLEGLQTTRLVGEDLQRYASSNVEASLPN